MIHLYLLRPFQFIILILVVFGCVTKDHNENKVRIQINSKTQLNAEVKLSSYTLIDQNTLTEAKTDSTGFCVVELTIQEPTFALIQIGKKYGEVFLSPGYNITVNETDHNYKIPLTFSGKGADVNNYVSWVNSNVESIKWANGRGLFDLTKEEFEVRFDSLKRTISDFHLAYIDSINLTDTMISVLDMKNKVKFVAVQQEYQLYQLIQLSNEVRAEHDFKDQSVNLIFDSLLLTDRYSDFYIMLNFYWRARIESTVAKYSQTSQEHTIPLITNTLITEEENPESIREFLMALNLQHWLSIFGLSQETDSVYKVFKMRYSKSRFLPTLQNVYDEWLAVQPGQPAPDFIAHTSDGNKVAKEDFKGKLVYMDVWATWCNPCIAEIPASKKLQAHFINENRVLFVNVSVDNDESAWLNFLAKEKDWPGLHVRLEPSEIESFYRKFKLYGIPGYILMDESGNILNIRAPRPSEGEIKDEIESQLEKFASTNL